MNTVTFGRGAWSTERRHWHHTNVRCSVHLSSRLISRTVVFFAISIFLRVPPSRLIRISLFREDDLLRCLIWVQAAHTKKKKRAHSSMPCPGLPFLNNLSRQLEWLFYEYALKIPLLCSFSPSLCNVGVCSSVCGRVAVCMQLFSAWNKGGVRAN